MKNERIAEIGLILFILLGVAGFIWAALIQSDLNKYHEECIQSHSVEKWTKIYDDIGFYPNNLANVSYEVDYRLNRIIYTYKSSEKIEMAKISYRNDSYSVCDKYALVRNREAKE